ncbi:Branched-chain alpha-keto acid dehydrogenase, E1 component, alpha subunit [hydrothermal vent metagenome]|uniref:Branched-chain alpha-keto acid dehydrogenase, E1 component, alpha subunit n=1 Tax=hydrothermal vent metagenome TaxID=652676 RepID=A0A3B0SP99_9ZZZZ
MVPSSGKNLNVPAPRHRPGEEAEFDDLDIPNAGVVSRPDIMMDPREMFGYANSLIRVLDMKNRAIGEWNPGLSADDMRKGLRDMLTTRIYDDRMQNMQRVGKMSFYMKSRGEEAVAVAQAMALNDEDMLFPSYRQQGLLISRGRDLLDMMNHCLSNSRDNCKGRQLPIMYSWKEGNFFSISGNLGTQFCQAVGWAVASAYKGDNALAATWIGEGTTATADFHHGMTFATVYNAPVILNIVNNQWAISSFQGFAGGEKATFAARGVGYGMPGLRVDGNDFLAVYAVTKWAAERAHNGGGPTMIELFTYRADAHSTSDDPTKYRPEHEPAAWPLGDPVERLKNHLIEIGEWSEERHNDAIKEITALVTRKYKEAESYGTLNTGERPEVSSMFEDIFKEQTDNLRRQRQKLGV